MFFGLHVTSVYPNGHILLKQHLGICNISIDHKKLKQCDFTHVKVATLVLIFGVWLYSPSLWGKRVVRITQWFLVFNEPNDFEAGAKIFQMLDPELEPKTIDTSSWSQSLKFEFRFHGLGGS